MNLSLGEIQTFVSDLEKAISFYRDKLGLSLKGQGEDWAIFNISDVEFVLMAKATAQLDKSEYGKQCETVMCLKSSKIEEDIQQLSASGVKIVKDVQTVPQGKFAVIQDDDSNYIEIIQN